MSWYRLSIAFLISHTLILATLAGADLANGRLAGSSVALFTRGRQTNQVSVIPQEDAVFLNKAAQLAFAQIELAKLAPGCTTRPELKRFAAGFIDHYTRVNIELGNLAAGKDVNIGGPIPVPDRQPQPSAANTAEEGPAADKARTRCGNANPIAPDTLIGPYRNQYLKLRALSGADFDRQFVRYTIENLNESIALYRMETSSGGVRTIKSWASKELGEIRGRLRDISRV
jgi:predicted outer membrane protein